jgi:hypothetical protein
LPLTNDAPSGAAASAAVPSADTYEVEEPQKEEQETNGKVS